MSTPGARPLALAERVDAVIVGAGASGLSLAGHLAHSGWRDRAVLVVDDGSRALDGRAWAYWSDTDDLLDTAVCASYDRFWVRTTDVAHLVTLNDYRYRVVRGRDLGRTVDAALAGAPGFRRVSGHVSQIRDGAREASVVVDGHTVRAQWVFDSVGLTVPPGPAPSAEMALAFVGRRIETDRDTFEAGAPTLMDFRTHQGRGLCFVYVLPSSPRVALVEHTQFTAGSRDPAEPGEAALDAYLREVLRGGGHRVLSTEHGTIPLVTRRPCPPGRRVVPIGTPGGMVKPSTGYGYARIQRHSSEVARSLALHGHPFDVQTRPARHRAFDGVLLDAIRREPAYVVDAFERLFVANPGDCVLAFLDDATTIGQEISTILTLPPAPFLRALRRVAVRAVRLRLSRIGGPTARHSREFR